MVLSSVWIEEGASCTFTLKLLWSDLMELNFLGHHPEAVTARVALEQKEIDSHWRCSGDLCSAI